MVYVVFSAIFDNLFNNAFHDHIAFLEGTESKNTPPQFFAGSYFEVIKHHTFLP